MWHDDEIIEQNSKVGDPRYKGYRFSGVRFVNCQRIKIKDNTDY